MTLETAMGGLPNRGARAQRPRVHGPLESFQQDGAILARRRHHGGRERAIPWMALVQVALIVTAVKVLLYADLGATVYMARAEALLQGAWYERIGGWLMQFDPLSRSVIDAVIAMWR